MMVLSSPTATATLPSRLRASPLRSFASGVTSFSSFQLSPPSDEARIRPSSPAAIPVAPFSSSTILFKSLRVPLSFTSQLQPKSSETRTVPLSPEAIAVFPSRLNAIE